MDESTPVWDRLSDLGIVRPGTRSTRRRAADAWMVGVGAAVVVLCALAVRDGTVGRLETEVFRTVNELPGFLEAPFWVAQLLGVLVAPLVLAGAAFALRRRALAAGLAATVGLKLAFEHAVIKALVERERPGTTIPDAILRGAPAAGLAFPSGHATFAFAIAGLMAPYLTKRWSIVLYVLAVAAATGRVYLGAHAPLDVVAGAGLGGALAGALNLALGVPGERQRSRS